MSRLLENSEEYRKKMLSSNVFNTNKDYNIGNSRALSDGDVHGKGETNTIGSSDDIKARNENVVKNMYNKSKEYNISNA